MWHFTIIVANIAGKESAERLCLPMRSENVVVAVLVGHPGLMWPAAVKKRAVFVPKLCKERQSFAAIDSRPSVRSPKDPSRAFFFPPLKLSEVFALYYLFSHLYWQFEVMLMAHSAEPGAHCSAPFYNTRVRLPFPFSRASAAPKIMFENRIQHLYLGVATSTCPNVSGGFDMCHSLYQIVHTPYCSRTHTS